MPEEKEIVKIETKLPYQYYEQQIIRRIHHFYLNQIIEEPSLYVDMIHMIRTAGPEDVVHIHLNTPGGVLDTGVQLVNAMRSSEAHVVCSLEAKSHSLGTLIFLAADEFIVHDNCIMMFHNYSGGVFGKGHEQIAEIDAMKKWFRALSFELYVPFLSEAEFEKIIDGGDLWVQSDEIRDRLTNMVELMEKQKLADEQAAQLEAEEAEQAALEALIAKRKTPRKKSAAKKKVTLKKS